VRYLCQPVWEMLLMEAWLRGDFKAPGFLDHIRDYCACKWIPNGWSWVDPVKEADGAKISIENNMTTLADILSAKGDDIDEVLESRARELVKIKNLEEKYDISMGPAAPPPAPSKGGQKSGDQTPDAKDNDGGNSDETK
jgi:capsid protein